MKKTVFVTVAIGVIIIVLTLLFKLHHWYGADILLIFGTIFNFFIVSAMDDKLTVTVVIN